jgi:T5SS/PEP-CTERM-associated repeat protein
VPIALAMSFTIAAALSTGPALGATRTWSAGSASWHTAENWLPMPHAVPTASDTAVINNGGTARVTSSGAANTLYLGSESSGNSGHVDISAGGVLGSFYVYIGDTGTGTATVSGAGARWQGTSPLPGIYELRVGRFGSGRLDILGGGTVVSSYSAVAWEPNSTGEVNVAGGSLWDNSNWIEVGARGNGRLNIRDGGQVTADSATIGSVPGSTGRVDIEGAGSSFTSDGSFWVAYEGFATVNMADGANLSTSSVWGGDGIGIEPWWNCRARGRRSSRPRWRRSPSTSK